MRRAWLAGCALGLALVSGSATGATASNDIKLRLQIGQAAPIEYNVRRVWRSDPKSAGGVDQVQNFSVRVTAAPISHGRLQVQAAIGHFLGKDLDSGDTVRLARIAPEVNKLRISALMGPHGIDSQWRGDTPNRAGITGSMAMKAAGLFQVGFLDLWYPTEPVHVGSTWKRTIHFGDLKEEGVGIEDFRGWTTPCVYTLFSIDRVRRIGVIIFSAKATSTFHARGQAAEIYRVEEQTGRWEINIDTGMPLRFHGDRTMSHRKARSVSAGANEHESNEFTFTDVVPLKAK